MTNLDQGSKVTLNGQLISQFGEPSRIQVAAILWLPSIYPIVPALCHGFYVPNVTIRSTLA